MMQQLTETKIIFVFPKKERTFVNNLLVHMSMLRRLATIDLWYIDEIVPGQKIADVIESKVAESDVIVLVLSSDFFAEDFTYSILEQIKRRYKLCPFPVIPVLAYACIWEYDDFVRTLEVFPRDKVPFAGRENRESAYIELVREIVETAQEIYSNKHGALSSSDDQ